ncbi:MAG: hypothetical protein ACW98U_05220 [Candidatus Thorarchaeota archaeon]
MSIISDIKSWLWIPAFWVVLYSLFLIVGIGVGGEFGPSFYWAVTLIGVPLTIAPITYKNLVGGGCNLQYQICGLVKGMFAGFVFMSLTMIADTIVWATLAPTLGWNPVSLSVTEAMYYVWFFSGIIGGFGARIVEVRGYQTASEITIAGFE